MSRLARDESKFSSSRPKRSVAEGPCFDKSLQIVEERSLHCASLRSASVETTEGLELIPALAAPYANPATGTEGRRSGWLAMSLRASAARPALI